MSFLATIDFIDQAENLQQFMSVADWLVFCLLLVTTFGFVAWGNRRKRRVVSSGDDRETLLDVLLMGRRLTLPLFVMTLVATYYGGIVGATEYYRAYGMSAWIAQGGFWYAAYLVFAFALVKKVRQGQSRTMPDLLHGLYGPKSGLVGAVFNLFNVLPFSYVLALGITLGALFGWAPYWGMAAGTVFVVLYSAGGGMRSVVFSDIIQFVLMCSGVALVLIFSITSVGSISWLMGEQSGVPTELWSWNGGQSVSSLLVWGFIAFGTLVDPNFYQRCLAAKSTKVARRGILLSTLVWVLFDFCAVFGSLYGLSQLPDTASDQAYLSYGLQLLPTGLKGYFLAGFVATILSTIDSYLFLSGSVLSYDLSGRNDHRGARSYLPVTVAVSAFTLLVAVLIEYNRTKTGGPGFPLAEIWKVVGGISLCSLVFPMMVGFTFRRGRITDAAFVTSALCGGGTYVLIHFAKMAVPQLVPAPLAAMATDLYFYFGLGGSAAGLLLGSRLFKPTTQTSD